MREKLERKCEDSSLAEKVMIDMESLIVESRIIESRVHGYASIGKTARYIRTKLLQKKFDADLVDEALAGESEILKNPETYRLQIEKIVQKGIQK